MSTVSADKQVVLRTVAFYEAGKGVLVLAVGLGMLAFIHADLQAWGERVINHLHLDPAHHFPRIFLQALEKASNQNLVLLAIGAAVYALGRFIEAYGLWYARGWAEWFAIITGGMYIPYEIYEIIRHVTAWKIGIFAINVLIVGYMCYLRYSSRKQSAAAERSAVIT